MVRNETFKTYQSKAKSWSRFISKKIKKLEIFYLKKTKKKFRSEAYKTYQSKAQQQIWYSPKKNKKIKKFLF